MNEQKLSTNATLPGGEYETIILSNSESFVTTAATTPSPEAATVSSKSEGLSGRFTPSKLNIENTAKRTDLLKF